MAAEAAATAKLTKNNAVKMAEVKVSESPSKTPIRSSSSSADQVSLSPQVKTEADFCRLHFVKGSGPLQDPSCSYCNHCGTCYRPNTGTTVWAYHLRTQHNLTFAKNNQRDCDVCIFDHRNHFNLLKFI